MWPLEAPTECTSVARRGTLCNPGRALGLEVASAGAKIGDRRTRLHSGAVRLELVPRREEREVAPCAPRGEAVDAAPPRWAFARAMLGVRSPGHIPVIFATLHYQVNNFCPVFAQVFSDSCASRTTQAPPQAGARLGVIGAVPDEITCLLATLLISSHFHSQVENA